MLMPILLAFGIALVASIAFTGAMRKLALRVGMVDKPGPRKVHLEPIPLLGGVAIYSAVLLAVLVSFGSVVLEQVLGIFAGATLVALVGTLDDRGLLHHQVKLFLGMPLAGLILLASGIHAQVFSTFIPGRTGSLADAALTVFWITGITASFSIFDYMDGLCAGIAAIAALFFTALAAASGQVLVSVLAASVAGAAIGFLRWNFNPAKIFMGDGGAMFLGFFMATLGLKLRMTGVSRGAGWLVPVLVLGVPIFDTFMVSISRARRGLLPFATPGKDHTGHRLANLGLGTRGAVLLMYGFGIVMGSLALVVSHLAAWSAFEVLVGLTVLASIAVAALEHAPYERQQPKPRPST
jgi:UDP-GlcNAc:undecaprenyl-phosphate GlcNAc-1-phosphate transferase